MSETLISTTTDSPFLGGNCEATGPWVAGGVIFSAQVTTVSGNQKKLRVYKSTDNGASFSEADSANAPSFWARFNTTRYGNFVYFFHFTGANSLPDPVRLGHSIFDLGSGKWVLAQTGGPQVHYLTTGTGINGSSASIACALRDTGGLLCHFRNDEVDSDPPNGEYFSKGEVNKFENGSWIDPHSGAYFSAFDPSFTLNYGNVDILRGASGRVHLVVYEDQLGNIHHVTLKPDNTKATLQLIDDYNYLAPGVSYGGCGGRYIAIPYRDQAGNVKVAIAVSADVPSWTITDVGITNGINSIGSQDLRLIASPCGCALFCVWNSGQRYTYYRVWDGTSWNDGGAGDILLHDGGAANTKQKLSLGWINSTTLGLMFEKRAFFSSTKNYSYASGSVGAYSGENCPDGGGGDTDRRGYAF